MELVAVNESVEGYKPEADFVEDSKEPLLDIDVNDSTEFWLIQWPINQLQPVDFDGKELSLKLRPDGRLGGFESSSGKGYDVVSFAAQEPNATVFVSSPNESKVVGRVSRRVCLVHYPEPEELEKSATGKRSEGPMSRSMSRLTGSRLRSGSNRGTGATHDTLTSAHSIDERTEELSPKPSKKRRNNTSAPILDTPTRSAGRSSHASEPESQMTNTTSGSELSHGGKSKKKKLKKTKVEE
ncbi:putative mediator-associated protein 2, plant [Dioscorea sansibarensis]